MVINNSNRGKSHFLIMPYGQHCDYDNYLKDGYSHLDENPKLLLFIAPTFNYCSSELMTFNIVEFARIENFANFDRDFFYKLNYKYNFEREALEFEREEVLYAHIKYLRDNYPEYKLFPIFYNNIKQGVIKSIIEDYWGECSFVLLTTMSVGLNYNDAKRIDEFHAAELEQNRANNLTHLDFSAFIILPEIMEFNKTNNFKFKRIRLSNSGDNNNNMASTTGYGAWYSDEM